MKTIENEIKNPLFKKLGWIGIGLCVLCCTLPILGTVVGIGALASLAFYFEKIAVGILLVTAVLFVFWIFSKRKSDCATSCDTHAGGTCNCKTEKRY
jgi:hypothetical protein